MARFGAKILGIDYLSVLEFYKVKKNKIPALFMLATYQQASKIH